MNEYSKETKKSLRELAGLAYERDMSRCLEVLYEHFKTWENGGISPFDLNDLIHEYHDGASRSMYSVYTDNEVSISVAFGLRQGVLSESELPEEASDDIKEIANAIAKKA